jgi:hypothetical protein
MCPSLVRFSAFERRNAGIPMAPQGGVDAFHDHVVDLSPLAIGNLAKRAAQKANLQGVKIGL